VEGQLSPSPATPAGAAGDRPVLLRPSVEPFAAPDGDLYLLRAGAGDLRIRDPDPADRALIAALADHAQRRSALGPALGLDPPRLEEKLAALSAAGVLIEGGSDGTGLDARDADRFSRQLPWLAELGDAPALQRRLRERTVVVLGCGGLGSWTLAALASSGVGRFVLVDDDRVERSNLNRQIVYGEADLGGRKVEAAAAWLERFDPRIDARALCRRIAGPGDVPALVSGVDVVVVAADRPPYLLARWVNAACVEAGVPFALAGQAPPVLKIGPIYWPGRSACFACHETALRAASPHYDPYVEHAQAAVPRSATLGPASGIVGSMLALELFHLLVGARPPTLGAAVTIDMRTLVTRREEVPRAPSCAACQHLG
jgi:molybdopterin-synthase adenylyltransferase